MAAKKLCPRTLRSVARAARKEQRSHERLKGTFPTGHHNWHWYQGAAYGFEVTADSALRMARRLEKAKAPK